MEEIIERALSADQIRLSEDDVLGNGIRRKGGKNLIRRNGIPYGDLDRLDPSAGLPKKLCGLVRAYRPRRADDGG